MGIFDRFKKETPGPGELDLDQVIKAYGLKKTKPYEPGYLGMWWEGSSGVTRFALQEHGRKLFVHLGTVQETPDIYLGRVSADEPLPAADSPSHIGRIVNDHAAAGQFMLLAWPPGEFDLPRLRNRGVPDCLVRLSPAVVEVMIYENYQGVTLLMQPRDRDQFERDLATGIELLKAVASRG